MAPIIYDKEQLWNRWFTFQHWTLCELKIPSEALVDYEHFYDFIFHQGDMYEIPFYSIDALSDSEVLCFYEMLESFFNCYHLLECDPANNGGKLYNERLESTIYRNLLRRYEFDDFGSDFPTVAQFVQRVAKRIDCASCFTP